MNWSISTDWNHAITGGVDAELVAMLTSMSAEEQKWLIRMLLKDMKLGLGQSRIFGIYHPDAQELYDVSNNLLKVHHVCNKYCNLFFC
jgi:DNA ligase-4